jgi:hypothetical protein
LSGNFGEAARHLEQALNVAPNFGPAALLLAVAHRYTPCRRSEQELLDGWLWGGEPAVQFRRALRNVPDRDVVVPGLREYAEELEGSWQLRQLVTDEGARGNDTKEPPIS